MGARRLALVLGGVGIAALALVWALARAGRAHEGRPGRAAEAAHAARAEPRDLRAPSQPQRDARAWGGDAAIPSVLATAGAPADGDSELSGWLLVDGAPPPEAIELALVHDGDGGRSTQSTSALGGFRFAGLPRDWSGWLQLPAGWSFERSGMVRERLRFPAPARELELEVRRVPLVRGRVVEATSRKPLAGAHVSLMFDLARGGGGMSNRDDATDTEGRFALPIESADLEQLVLTVSHAASGARGGAAFEGAEIPHDLDVGVVEVRLGRTLRFQVLDTAGAPIPSALAAADSVGRVRCDADGRGAFPGLGEADRELRFAAPGHRVLVLAVPPADVEELEVILERCNSLTVVVDGPVALLGAAQVHVGCGVPLLPSTERGFPPMDVRELTGFTRFGDPDADGPALGWWIPDGDAPGVVRLDDLVVGEPLTVRLCDASGATLVERRVPPLGQEEQRREVLELPATAGALRGRVLDDEGNPLAGARVRVLERAPLVENRRSRSAQSQGDGSFVFAPLGAASVDLEVTKPGWAPRTLRDVPVERGAPPLEIRLEPALDLAVEVRDPAGALVEGGSLEVDVPGRVDDGADGTFVVRGLPAQPLRATLHLAGRVYARDHDPRGGPIVFRVPAHGSLELRWPPLPSETWGALELLSVDSVDEPLRIAVPARLARGSKRVPAVLPGRYAVCLRDRSVDGAPGTALYPAAEVAVEAGATALLELGP